MVHATGQGLGMQPRRQGVLGARRYVQGMRTSLRLPGEEDVLLPAGPAVVVMVLCLAVGLALGALL